MKTYPIIVSISEDYFSSHEQYKELMHNDGENRPYVQGAIFSDQNNDYFVPLRTSSKKSDIERFPGAFVTLPAMDKPDAVLDIRKMIVLNREVPVTINRRKLQYNDQYQRLVEKQDELWEKANLFVEEYKQFVISNKSLNENLSFKYSTLKYYHEELGLNQELKQDPPQQQVSQTPGEATGSDGKFTSLMKQKYGVTKSSPLKLTEKDTAYTSFRKLADNIYKNGDWTTVDEINAADTMVRNHYAWHIGEEAFSHPIDVQETSIDERVAMGRNRIGNKTAYTATGTVETGGGPELRKTVVLLDPDNKIGTHHNEHYQFTAPGESKKRYYAIGNRNRAIGYDKLQRDILKEYDKHTEKYREQGLNRSNLEGYLRQLVDPSNAGKKREFIFQRARYGDLSDETLNAMPRDEGVNYWEIPPTDDSDRENFNWRDLTNAPDSENKLNLDKAPYILEDPDGGGVIKVTPKRIKYARDKNGVIDFVQNYIETTYDIILQQEYEKDIEKHTRAGAWDTKKNINQETQKLMESTVLNRQFRYIELDNDVDLKLFQHFETEMQRVYDVLPKMQEQPELRLRKLGNYHALGLYQPLRKGIAIDFRDHSDNIGGIGVQSFIHEYGHFVDYSAKRDQVLSLSEGFKPIISGYRENLYQLQENSYVRAKSAYYETPTEIFARAFEIYVSEAGLSSSLLKDHEMYQDLDEYQPFDTEIRAALTNFFDKEFPNLKGSIFRMKEPIITEEPKKHIMEGQNDHWDNVIMNVEETNEAERRVKNATNQIDNHGLYGNNEAWNSVIENIALSENEVSVEQLELDINTQNTEETIVNERVEEPVEMVSKNLADPVIVVDPQIHDPVTPSQEVSDKHTNGTPVISDQSEGKKLQRKSNNQRGSTAAEREARIQIAMSRSIIDVADSLGMKLFKDGNVYRWDEHDSFTFFPNTNTYKWFSRGDKAGNPINLVQTIAGLTFNQTLDYLNNPNLQEVDPEKFNEPKKPFKYFLKEHDNKDVVRKYLMEERSLSPEVVSLFERKGLLAEATRRYKEDGYSETIAVFKSFDFSGKHVGANQHGMTTNYEKHPKTGRLRKNLPSSDGRYGMWLDVGTPERLIFFEAPIDLMSYYDLHKNTPKLEGARLVAMNGVNKVCISAHVKQLYAPQAVCKPEEYLGKLNTFLSEKENAVEIKEKLAEKMNITLAVDNDKAGNEFIESVNEEYSMITFREDIPPLNPGEKKMDWNQYVQEQKKPSSDFLTEKSLSQGKALDELPVKQEIQPLELPADQLSIRAVEALRNVTQEPEMLTKYLDKLGEFNHLSPLNVALIQEQCPNAKAVKTFKQWQTLGKELTLDKEDLVFSSRTFVDKKTGQATTVELTNLSVKENEKGLIHLIRPVSEDLIPVTDKVGQLQFSSEGKPMYKPMKQATAAEREKLKNGSIKKKSVIVRDPDTGQPTFQDYKVFEVSQTNLKSEAYPKVLSQHFLKEENLENAVKGITDLARKIGVSIHLDPMVGEKRSTFSVTDQKVLINPALSGEAQLSEAMKQLCHATLDNPKMKLSKEQQTISHTEAVLAGHVLAKHFGLDSYVSKEELSQFGKELNQLDDRQLSSSFSRIQKASNQVAKAVSDQINAIPISRGIHQNLQFGRSI